ncbi:hypothetical protein E2C01_024018 [Portunus trituberculatus]|uniref:Uncharacterized protein n=1 Tax=Portunus trituberculatus TaxID=210409 RepID=A0A5B7EAS7_PORTR|nr:hypothetical protein [Portunus trituberculatus]
MEQGISTPNTTSIATRLRPLGIAVGRDRIPYAVNLPLSLPSPFPPPPLLIPQSAHRSKLPRPNQKSATFPGPPLPPQPTRRSLGAPAADPSPQATTQSDALDQDTASSLAHRPLPDAPAPSPIVLTKLLHPEANPPHGQRLLSPNTGHAASIDHSLPGQRCRYPCHSSPPSCRIPCRGNWSPLPNSFMLYESLADDEAPHAGTARNTHLYLLNTAAPRGLLLLKPLTEGGGGGGDGGMPSQQRLNDRPAWLQAGPAPRSSPFLLFEEADHTQAGPSLPHGP